MGAKIIFYYYILYFQLWSWEWHSCQRARKAQSSGSPGGSRWLQVHGSRWQQYCIAVHSQRTRISTTGCSSAYSTTNTRSNSAVSRVQCRPPRRRPRKTIIVPSTIDNRHFVAPCCILSFNLYLWSYLLNIFEFLI